jgi:Domain of unknown function (DUF4157)
VNERTQIQTKTETSSFSPFPSLPTRTKLLQRKCACGGTPGVDGECAECRKRRLQRRASNHAKPETAPPIVHETLSSPGQPLDAGTRAFVEPRFGHNFSRTPIHSPTEGAIQTKLAINRPGDSYEQEADRVSEQIMRMPESRVQRKCACGGTPGPTGECEECRTKRLSLQHMSLNAADPDAGGFAPPIVHDVLRSPTRSLDPQTRAFMEPHFGHDFSQVRVHADPSASYAADAVQAQAFTFGSDIVFGSGRFAPSTPAGRKLLAHELTHVVQQGAAPVAATHAPGEAAGEGATEAGDLRTSRVSEPGRLQRQPTGGNVSPKTEACPPMEPGEREEAAKAQLRLVERIPQQEWLIYGFPIGGSEISEAEAGLFISDIARSLMRSHFIYMIGEDLVDVLGFSDCFAGPQVDNHVLRQLRAAKFCAGVWDNYMSTALRVLDPLASDNYPDMIRSCEPAPADQYVGSNATRADRAQNRSILIRRVAAAKVQFQEGSQSFPYNPKVGPSEALCAAYEDARVRDILGPVYSSNAHRSCLVTPDEPHNNCVRDCLQDKMWTLVANEYHSRKPNDPPMDINTACWILWIHHRDCYHDCGCASEFIDYLAFNVVCNTPLPWAVDSAAINLLNRCMPATKNDKYLHLPVD